MDIDKYLQVRNYDGKKLLLDVPHLFIWGWVLLFLADNFKSQLPSYVVSSPEPIRVLIWLFFLIVFFTATKPTFHYLKCLFFSKWPWSKTREYKFDNSLKGVIFQGIAKVEGESLRITNSGSGLLIKNLWWKDFITTFKFKFEKLETAILRGFFNTDSELADKIHYFNYVGFLFRAQGLEDYFMFSIGVLVNKDDYDKLINKNKLTVIITPHIRLGGKWEKFGGQALGEIELNKYNSVRCELNGVVANLEINGNSVSWTLPTNFDPETINPGQGKKYDPDKLTSTRISSIPFRNTFGMIGFRAMGAENVLIKDLIVRRLA